MSFKAAREFKIKYERTAIQKPFYKTIDLFLKIQDIICA